jgi:ABC-2 type transport system ATP-binding protein
MNTHINSSATSSILEIRELQKKYGTQRVLDGINLNIQPGAVVGLIGRNGAGKSTLLRCMMGMLASDSGTCSVFGESALAISDNNKARIGYVPQQPEALGWLTVKQMLQFVSGFYATWDHTFVTSTLKRWNINTNALLSKLSPGERQRIALLRAMAYSPELLVLDEPAAALDPVARRELLREIVTRAADNGTTVIFSTHIVSDLERVASEIVFLHDHSIVLHMPMDEIKERTMCLRLSANIEPALAGRVPGEISRHQNENGTMSLVITRDENKEWPALCKLPNIRAEAMGLEDLFIEVAK